jgi:hypothetical protein
MTEDLEEQLNTAINERQEIVKKYLENHGNINEWVSKEVISTDRC